MSIPVGNCIETFLHCAKCLSEKPDDTTPREWASLEIGFTSIGMQVWCKRHECNIMHIDFQKQKHPMEDRTLADVVGARAPH